MTDPISRESIVLRNVGEIAQQMIDYVRTASPAEYAELEELDKQGRVQWDVRLRDIRGETTHLQLIAIVGPREKIVCVREMVNMAAPSNDPAH